LRNFIKREDIEWLPSETNGPGFSAPGRP
jgi:hypothetical protein